MKIKSSQSKQKVVEASDIAGGTRETISGKEWKSCCDQFAELAARVRSAKAAAQRAMKAFGDRSKYDITIIHWRPKVSEADVDLSGKPEP